MHTKHSKILEEILRSAQQHAGRGENGQMLSVDHLFLAILRAGRGHAMTMLRQLLSEEELEYARRKIGQTLGQKPILLGGTPAMEKRLHDVSMLRIENTLRNMYIEMLDAGQRSLHTGHFLAAVLKDQRHIATQVLGQFYGITYEKIKPLLSEFPQEEDEAEPTKKIEAPDNQDEEESESAPSAGTSRKGHTTQASMLEKFGIELTKTATEGKLDPVVGRDAEIERLIQVPTSDRISPPPTALSSSAT